MLFFKSDKKKDFFIEETYQNIIERSRSKFFYLDMRIDDNFESRFDIIIMHSFLIFYYYRNLGKNKSHYSQSLFDYMFKDFDNNLREMGFGDIAVNKKMKVFITAFYGRISKYSKGIDLMRNSNNEDTLVNSIKNNLYKGKPVDEYLIKFFANYMIENIINFETQSEDENFKSRFTFVQLPKEVN